MHLGVWPVNGSTAAQIQPRLVLRVPYKAWNKQQMFIVAVKLDKWQRKWQFNKSFFYTIRNNVFWETCVLEKERFQRDSYLIL